jgi:predicted membrane-bound mannosyltransferase
MDPRLSSRTLAALSVCYGIVVAILGAVGSSALTVVAVVGALVIGGLWIVRGLFLSRGRST